MQASDYDFKFQDMSPFHVCNQEKSVYVQRISFPVNSVGCQQQCRLPVVWQDMTDLWVYCSRVDESIVLNEIFE